MRKKKEITKIYVYDNCTDTFAVQIRGGLHVLSSNKTCLASLWKWDTCDSTGGDLAQLIATLFHFQVGKGRLDHNRDESRWKIVQNSLVEAYFKWVSTSTFSFDAVLF